MSITDVLNTWNEMGVFSYVIPFLLIFAVVYGILSRIDIFGKKDDSKSKGINAMIALAIGLIALLNDTVSTFFATIFPRFGVGLAIFLVLIISLGFFYRPDSNGKWPGAVVWIGWLVGIGVVLWAWDAWGSNMGGFGNFIGDFFWPVIVLGAIVAMIYWMTKSDAPATPGKP